MIKIDYVQSYSDDTYKYAMSFPDEMTVGEFIEEWLKNKNEWGYFEVCGSSIFLEPKCEYANGKIKGDPLPEYLLTAPIIEVQGSGGWSRSDFLFLI